jgi:hypothetical protein
MMTLDKSFSTKQIIETLKRDTGIEYTYGAVHKAKEALLNESSEAQRAHFRQIPEGRTF